MPPDTSFLSLLLSSSLRESLQLFLCTFSTNSFFCTSPFSSCFFSSSFSSTSLPSVSRHLSTGSLKVVGSLPWLILFSFCSRQRALSHHISIHISPNLTRVYPLLPPQETPSSRETPSLRDSTSFLTRKLPSWETPPWRPSPKKTALEMFFLWMCPPSRRKGWCGTGVRLRDVLCCLHMQSTVLCRSVLCFFVRGALRYVPVRQKAHASQP